MDYEQKYKEALSRARVVNPGTKDYNIVTTIFPELKKSDDERIRENAIQIIRYSMDGTDVTLPLSIYKECIAWLEKQGEQKLANKVESKFKVGDWILIDNPYQIKSIDSNGNYIVQYCDAEETHLLSKNFCDSHFRLWTIQDAVQKIYQSICID